MYRLFL
ncbi:protein yebF, partial [Yersinia pestis PY-25]